MRSYKLSSSKPLFSTRDNLQVLPCEPESESLPYTVESPKDVKEGDQNLVGGAGSLKDVCLTQGDQVAVVLQHHIRVQFLLSWVQAIPLLPREVYRHILEGQRMLRAKRGTFRKETPAEFSLSSNMKRVTSGIGLGDILIIL